VQPPAQADQRARGSEDVPDPVQQPCQRRNAHALARCRSTAPPARTALPGSSWRSAARRRADPWSCGRRPGRASARGAWPCRGTRGRQLGRRHRHPGRPVVGLPSQDGLQVAAPLQRPRAGRTGRPAPAGGAPAPVRARAGPDHPAGRLRATRPPAPRRCGAAGPRPAHGAGALDPGHPHRRCPGRGHPGRPQPGPPDPAARRRPLAGHPLVDDQHRPGLCPKEPRSSPATPPRRRNRP
jgi:translation initiation factor IF-2